MREAILVVGIPFKPTYPEDLNFLSPGSTGNLLCAFVVDGDHEDIDESAISIGVRVIIFRRGDHDIRSCAKVDDIRTSLEIIRCVVDTQCFVERDLATFIDISFEDVFSGGFAVLNQQS